MRVAPLLTLLVAACGGGETARFTDVTAGSGIDFTMTSGRTPSTQIVEVKGGGLALLDHDGDGDLDLFVPNGATMDAPAAGPGSRLYRNDGGMRFSDVTVEVGIDHRGWGMGVAVGDVDGNGRDDLFVSCFGRNALLCNEGGRFTDTTEAAGLAHGGWGTGCAFGDVDGDGDLDLYLVNYIDFDLAAPPPRTTMLGVEVFDGPSGLTAQADVLYANDGAGTFRDVTQESGCGAVEPAYGLGAVILDFDDDGHQDVFVGNDSMRNFLFHNRGGGRFTEVGLRSGLASNGDGESQATMGIAIADVDGDGRADVFTTNFMSDTNTLHLNRGGLQFADRTQIYGLAIVSRPFLGWASMFYDFDHDGDEDLLLFNGHVYPDDVCAALGTTRRQTPLLFEREGARFRRVEAKDEPWLATGYCDRSAVFGDLDGDGDVDAAVGELNGPVRLLRNDGAAGAWLIVSLHDARPGVGNRRGLGSKVVLRTTTTVRTRWIHGGGSFQSSCAQEAHFGVPAGEEVVELEITWADGFRQTVRGVELGRRMTVEHGLE
ncbi:MAG: CRTAC1 family protein [Planctomycetota bacterium]|nr:CRTAC1 family protein [Planctomycetota bacterium]